MISSGLETSLGLALTSVRRRLIARRFAVGALVGAVAASLPAWMIGGVSGATLTLVGALAGALWRSRRAVVAAEWIDASVAEDDLVVSGAAVIDGRAGTPALAAAVVAAATARASAVRRPRLAPAACALVGVVVLAIAALMSGGRTRLPADSADADHVVDPAVVVSPAATADATSVPVAATAPGATLGPREAWDGGDDADRDRHLAGDGDRDGLALGSSRSTIAGTGVANAGTGESSTTALRTPSGAATGAPRATPRSTVDVTVPAGGASSDIVAVPTRYRALVAAYLESR